MEKAKINTKPSTFQRVMEQRAVQLFVGLASLVLAYLFASWAIDSGSLLDYAIAFLWLVVGLRELANVARNRRKEL
jgi:uncharacterized membrane protein HdeD (DUF308 family)